MLNKYIGSTIGLGISAIIVGGIAQWLGITPGNLIDWSIAIASFWWLIAIVTIPWNIYFEARETITEAEISKEKDLEIDEKQLDYVYKIARRSLIGAIALHFISALALYLLATTGISNVGYVSSGLTLLLTVLRPSVRGYQYLNRRLSSIKKEVKYPRKDAIELDNRVTEIEKTVREIETKLDTKDSTSLIGKQQTTTSENRQQINRLFALLEEERAKNSVEHERLSKKTKNAISQLNEDSQFLSHVREIIRFVKTA